MTSYIDYLIVGSGLFGSVFAYEATKHGKKCLVIDKRPHGGGAMFIVKIRIILTFINMGRIFFIPIMKKFGII